jgi:excisionase family DNA binding protein
MVVVRFKCGQFHHFSTIGRVLQRLHIIEYRPIFKEFFMTKSFLSLNDLAEIAGVTPMTVYRWIQYADLPKLKIGRSYRFAATEAMEWLENGGPQRAIDARREELGKAE